MNLANILSTDEALYRLIHHKSFRESYLAEANIGLSEEVQKDLATIDRQQLVANAQNVANKLLHGNHQGGQGLSAVFKQTLQAWHLQTEQNHLLLIYDFLESHWFENYNELPFVGEGLCLEQAFYEFMTENVWPEGSPLEALVRDEFLSSVFSHLAQETRPSFSLDTRFFKENKVCRYSVQMYGHKLTTEGLQKRPHFVLYSATQGHFMAGEITPLIADLLYVDSTGKPPHMGEILKRHKVNISVYLQTYAQLVQMGLLPH